MASYVPLPTLETQALETARVNYGLLLAGLTSYFQNPSQASLQSLTSLATACGCVNVPKVTYTLDGENFQWMEFQQFVIDKMEALRVQGQRSYGPFSVES